jgi:hypothetical protein
VPSIGYSLWVSPENGSDCVTPAQVAMGLPELVMSSYREYEDTLVRLAGSPEEYSRLRVRVGQSR